MVNVNIVSYDSSAKFFLVSIQNQMRKFLLDFKL